MSKNSFTQNFNDCVAGLPIASVAAHMVLHEGLGKDLLKVGVPAAILAGLYNYGDDISQGISDWGKEHEDMKLGNWNIGQAAQSVGNKLNDWHTAGTHWMQDITPGRWAGLGGVEALKRQTINDTAEKYASDTAAALQSKINDIYKDQSLTPEQQEQQVNSTKEQFKLAGRQAGETAWLQKQGELDSANSGGKTNSGSLHASESQYNKLNGLNQQTKLANAAAQAGADGGRVLAGKTPQQTTPQTTQSTKPSSGEQTKPNQQNTDMGGKGTPWRSPADVVSNTLGHRKLLSPDEITSRQAGEKIQHGSGAIPAAGVGQSTKPQPSPVQLPDANKLASAGALAGAAGATAFSGGGQQAGGKNVPSAQPEPEITQSEAKVGVAQKDVPAQDKVFPPTSNLFSRPGVQHRELVNPSIPPQPTQPIQPAQGMQLNATPEVAQRLLGNQQSMAAGTDTNLNNAQDPVFNGKRRQFLNGANFDTQNQLKGTTLGGSFTPNQNHSTPSPFGPSAANARLQTSSANNLNRMPEPAGATMRRPRR